MTHPSTSTNQRKNKCLFEGLKKATFLVYRAIFNTPVKNDRISLKIYLLVHREIFYVAIYSNMFSDDDINTFNRYLLSY